MSGDITLGYNALAKILLHAAKYPHLAVNGILVGVLKKSEGSSEVIIKDAIPLFHMQLGLAPMFEVALTQIEQLFKSKGWIIAGYYQGNENLKDILPDFMAMKVVEKIAENNNEACLIMIDNLKMSINLDCAPLIVSQLSSDGKWKIRDRSSIHIESGALDITSQLLQRSVQHDIFDFDNHLDDISCDWTNKHINALIQSLKAASGH